MANSLDVPSMQDLLSAGVHFGHKVSRGHPKMKPYIFGARDGVHIIDLEKSEQLLQEATKAAYEFGKAGKTLLIVGTKKQAREIVKQLAEEVGAPYLTERWVGGILTNFDEMRRNIRKLTSLKEEQQKGQLSRYTKKEQLLISRKLEKFELQFGGVLALEKLPDGLFVVDAVNDITAVKEAQRLGITLFGISDTNADPNWFDWPVAANDDGIKSIKIVCETVIRAYGKGLKESGNKNIESTDKKAEVKETKVKKEETKKEVRKDDSAEKTDAIPVTGIEAETAALEEEVEKVVLEESERKVE